MFHVMNSSRGRIKLARDSSETIINPLTGLDTSDPTSFHKQPPPQQQQNQQQNHQTPPQHQHQQNKSSLQQILRSTSLQSQSNSTIKKNSSKSSPQTISTPRRSSSIGFTTPSPNQFSVSSVSHSNSNSGNGHQPHHRASISGISYRSPTPTTSSHSKKLQSKTDSKK